MSRSTVRAGLAALLVGVLAGCSSTVAGLAVKAPESTDSDGASVALMDTGPYETAASHPYGTAGDNRASQSILESQHREERLIGEGAGVGVAPEFLDVVDAQQRQMVDVAAVGVLDGAARFGGAGLGSAGAVLGGKSTHPERVVEHRHRAPGHHARTARQQQGQAQRKGGDQQCATAAVAVPGVDVMAALSGRGGQWWGSSVRFALAARQFLLGGQG